jgi:hypothetical protein
MKQHFLYSLTAVVVLSLGASGYVFAQHMAGSGHRHALHEHNEFTMPGLRGENASAQESEELALLFRKFETLTREVENLPNGIRTVTTSSDQEVIDALVSHAVGMIDRVHAKDDPKIIIQSPTLDTFFLHGDEIVSDVSVTEEGLIVIQTSENPKVAAAMQIHAAEVTAMVDRGMAAVHHMMMEQRRGH